MFFEVLSLTYHSPITIELLIYGVWLGTRAYSSRRGVVNASATSSGARKTVTEAIYDAGFDSASRLE